MGMLLAYELEKGTERELKVLAAALLQEISLCKAHGATQILLFRNSSFWKLCHHHMGYPLFPHISQEVNHQIRDIPPAISS